MGRGRWRDRSFGTWWTFDAFHSPACKFVAALLDVRYDAVHGQRCRMQALTDFGGICLFCRIWVTSPRAVSRNKGEAACSDAADVSAVRRDAGRAIRDDSAGAIRRHMESRPLRATRTGDSKAMSRSLVDNSDRRLGYPLRALLC